MKKLECKGRHQPEGWGKRTAWAKELGASYEENFETSILNINQDVVVGKVKDIRNR